MNKTVLVIGASGGMGKQLSLDLIKDGYSVIGTYNETLIDVPNIQTFHLNLLSENSLNAFIEKIKDESLYGFVNCAGFIEYEGKNVKQDIEVWNKTIKINLTSNYVLAKYLQNSIQENGKFIMISSTDAMYGSSITASYSVSKAGINSLTKSLSLLFKSKTISVNSIAPGWVKTPMIEDTDENFIKAIEKINPTKRIGTPKDISNVVRFLLKEESNYINGQVITIDGGYTNQDPTLLIEEKSLTI